MRSAITLLLVLEAASFAGEVRPGVWAASALSELPLPTSGYQVYLVGELHGLAENGEIQLRYLQRLHQEAGVRDVAIEEDAVYEREAQRFVAGATAEPPQALCLRADVLRGIRRLNEQLPVAERIRIHLVDVDSPAPAIRHHLELLKREIGAKNIPVPEAGDIARDGLTSVARLRRLAASPRLNSELRTVELSIRTLQQGLEVGLKKPKGSPYLDSREEGIVGNVLDIIREGVPLLVLYGADHVSRTVRKDGGPSRNQPFKPMALQLREAGIRAYSLITFPLKAEVRWRGSVMEMPWTASDGALSSGERFDQLLESTPGMEYLLIDKTRENSRLPSQDITKMQVESLLLIREAKAMTDSCPPSN